MKKYCFDLFVYGYTTHFYVEADRLSYALERLYEFYLDLGIPDKVRLSRVYRVFRDSAGNPIIVRHYSLKKEVKCCFELCSPSTLSLVSCAEYYIVPEFVKKVREYFQNDEKETRPENLTVAGSWYLNDH